MEKAQIMPVEDTNMEAMAAKVSAISKGYFTDPYAKQFCSTGNRKDIVINRGYWSRVFGIQTVVRKFLTTNPAEIPKQIVSIGCGYDTMFWNLMDEVQKKAIPDNFRFFECDLASVVKRKIGLITKSGVLTEGIRKASTGQEVKISDETILSNKFSLFGTDLNDLKSFKETLQSIGLDYSLPTLIYSECVFAYIKPENVLEFPKLLTSLFPLVFFVDYEMMYTTDNFTKIMMENFASKGCPLLGISEFFGTDAIKKRMEEAGFQEADIYDMKTLYYSVLDPNERRRIEKLEWMDELEELALMQSHYFMGVFGHLKEEIRKAGDEKAKSLQNLLETVKFKPKTK